ncbi:hypothetical protein BB561_000776 [Smittium simulii]|uniref:Golgi apparatus membrane protein TVP38 n=1 Tax=Smittium simulii TaxID=133385 RepID=A0A2T9YXJ7_9FUNG|nr:hypothetical protein BB561_000776 [Smittium simulii]
MHNNIIKKHLKKNNYISLDFALNNRIKHAWEITNAEKKLLLQNLTNNSNRLSIEDCRAESQSKCETETNTVVEHKVQCYYHSATDPVAPCELHKCACEDFEFELNNPIVLKKLPKNSYRTVWVWLSLLLYLAMAITVITTIFFCKAWIITRFLRLTIWLKRNILLGFLALISALCVLSFPPFLGYGIIITFCGFVYGFPLGFIPSFFGGLFGSISCFLLGKSAFKSYSTLFLHKYKEFEAFSSLLDKKGFKFLLLFRFAPYPVNISNVLLSTTNVSFGKYCLATAISLIKLLVNVYEGSQLNSISEMLGYKVNDSNLTQNNTSQSKKNSQSIFKNNDLKTKIIFLASSYSFGILFSIYFYFLIKKELKTHSQDKKEMLE